jgi:hypothetical protein
MGTEQIPDQLAGLMHYNVATDAEHFRCADTDHARSD